MKNSTVLSLPFNFHSTTNTFVARESPSFLFEFEKPENFPVQKKTTFVGTLSYHLPDGDYVIQYPVTQNFGVKKKITIRNGKVIGNEILGFI